MYITIRHEIRHARKAWLGNLVDPCLLSGVNHKTSIRGGGKTVRVILNIGPEALARICKRLRSPGIDSTCLCSLAGGIDS